MGFRKHLDYNTVQHNIYMAGVELCSPHNDGFTQWEIKQDIYRLKWLIDEILQKSSTFNGEEEFLREHDKALVWRKLKE